AGRGRPAGPAYSRARCDAGRRVAGEGAPTAGPADVDRTCRGGDLPELALGGLDAVCSGFGRVRASQFGHLVGHVEAVGETGGPHPLGGEEDVDPTTGSQVEDGLALVQFGDGDGVAATEAGLGGTGRSEEHTSEL